MPKNMRHVVKVMRPAKATNTIGNTQGQPDTICNAWPCSIETLSGREAELARQTFAAATLKVEGYGNPKKPIRESDYLEFIDGVTGTKDKPRKLYVGVVNDKHQNGVELSLLCGEER
jgi:hypothetical protein